jgi:hypothetical protein
MPVDTYETEDITKAVPSSSTPPSSPPNGTRLPGFRDPLLDLAPRGPLRELPIQSMGVNGPSLVRGSARGVGFTASA